MLLDSELFYYVISSASIFFFMSWAMYNGVVKKDICFGLIGNIRKTGKSARNWGIIFTLFGLFGLVLLNIAILA